jgi:hypothetical protein
MYLYQVETNQEGNSYERCYIVAPDRGAAKRMLLDKYPQAKCAWKLSVIHDCSKPIITELSTDGWFV